MSLFAHDPDFYEEFYECEKNQRIKAEKKLKEIHKAMEKAIERAEIRMAEEPYRISLSHSDSSQTQAINNLWSEAIFSMLIKQDSALVELKKILESR